MERAIDKIVQDFGYICSVNFGSGYLSEYPAINFFRKDILKKEYVNTEKPSQQYGMYIWFSYEYKKENLFLKLTLANKY